MQPGHFGSHKGYGPHRQEEKTYLKEVELRGEMYKHLCVCVSMCVHAHYIHAWKPEVNILNINSWYRVPH